MLSNASSVVPSQFENSEEDEEYKNGAQPGGDTFDVGEDAVVGNVA